MSPRLLAELNEFYRGCSIVSGPRSRYRRYDKWYRSLLKEYLLVRGFERLLYG